MKIIGMSLTHNDKSKGWLEKWLKENSQYFDSWVILDDCSDDGTFEYLSDVNVDCFRYISKTDKPTFAENENKIRRQLWNKVREIAEPGDWIVPIDSDEIICSEFKDEIPFELCREPKILVFRKIEMWDGEHYNVKGMWSNYFARMFPYFDVEWGDDRGEFHCGSIPREINNSLPRKNVNVRVKHLAYSSQELRDKKYKFMMSSGQQKDDINLYHLQTLKDEPILKKFEEIKNIEGINVFFVCDCLYRLPPSTLDFVKNNKFGANIVFIVSECDFGLVEQIRSLKNENVKISVIKYEDSHFLNNVQNKIGRDRIVALNNFRKYLEENNTTIFVDGERPINEDLVEYFVTTDRGVVCHRDGKLLSLSKKALQFVFENSIAEKFVEGYGSVAQSIGDKNGLVWIGSMDEELCLMVKNDC